MQFIFSTGSLWTYSIERCFEFAAAAGFDGMEIMVDQRWETRQPHYLQRLMAQFSLPILAVHNPFAAPPGWPLGKHNYLRQSVTVAEAVGSPVVVHHLPWRVGFVKLDSGGKSSYFLNPFGNPERPYRQWLANGGYKALQSETGVKLCIENMPATRVWGRDWNRASWNNIETIQRFLHLTLDTTHLATWGLDPVEVYSQWHGRVHHIHLSNFDGREHRRPEDGQVNLARFLRLLVEMGYDGAVSLELHPDALEAGGDDGRIVELLSHSLACCREWAKPMSHEQ
ncbi:MAG: sugar phosphate isomerase/epimerase family protein [Anaerolineae bacterium]